MVGVFRLRAHPSRGYRFSPGAPLNMTVKETVWQVPKKDIVVQLSSARLRTALRTHFLPHALQVFHFSNDNENHSFFDSERIWRINVVIAVGCAGGSFDRHGQQIVSGT